MDESFAGGPTVNAKLKVWYVKVHRCAFRHAALPRSLNRSLARCSAVSRWDASSAGPRVAPSLLAVLVAALAAAFA